MNTSINFRSLKLLESLCGVKSNLLLESLLMQEGKVDDIYTKFYSKISREEFDQITKADPTTKENPEGQIDKMGNYSKWLLGLYANNGLKLEDLYKATEYLTVFAKNSGKLPVDQRDIQKIKSLPDLFRLVRPFNGQQTKGEEKREIKATGADKLYEDNEWTVLWIKTEEAAKYYAKGTQWCTGGNKNNMFQHYHDQGNIYVNINKNTNEKFQFHFESLQYMDAEDDEIEPDEILSPAVIKFYAHLRNKIGRKIPFTLDNSSSFDATVNAQGQIEAISSHSLYHTFQKMLKTSDYFTNSFFTTIPFNIAGAKGMSVDDSKKMILYSAKKQFPLTCFSDEILDLFNSEIKSNYAKIMSLADDNPNIKNELESQFYMNHVPGIMRKAMMSNGTQPDDLSKVMAKVIYKWAGLDDSENAGSTRKVTNNAIWQPLVKYLIDASPFYNTNVYIDDVKLESVFQRMDVLKLGDFVKNELSKS